MSIFYESLTELYATVIVVQHGVEREGGAQSSVAMDRLVSFEASETCLRSDMLMSMSTT